MPVVAGVAALLLVVGVSYAVLTSGKTPDSSASISGAEDDGPTASVTATTTASASTPPSTTTPAATTPAATTSTAAVDKTVKVTVLNSVTVKGLAARVKANLTADGWNVTSTGNSRRERGLATTKVYYGRSPLRATARKLAKDLQFGQAVLSSTGAGGSGLTVVLGQDAE